MGEILKETCYGGYFQIFIYSVLFGSIWNNKKFGSEMSASKFPENGPKIHDFGPKFLAF